MTRHFTKILAAATLIAGLAPQPAFADTSEEEIEMEIVIAVPAPKEHRDETKAIPASRADRNGFDAGFSAGS